MDAGVVRNWVMKKNIALIKQIRYKAIHAQCLPPKGGQGGLPNAFPPRGGQRRSRGSRGRRVAGEANPINKFRGLNWDTLDLAKSSLGTNLFSFFHKFRGLYHLRRAFFPCFPCLPCFPCPPFWSGGVARYRNSVFVSKFPEFCENFLIKGS